MYPAAVCRHPSPARFAARPAFARRRLRPSARSAERRFRHRLGRGRGGSTARSCRTAFGSTARATRPSGGERRWAMAWSSPRRRTSHSARNPRTSWCSPAPMPARLPRTSTTRQPDSTSVPRSLRRLHRSRLRELRSSGSHPPRHRPRPPVGSCRRRCPSPRRPLRIRQRPRQLRRHRLQLPGPSRSRSRSSHLSRLSRLSRTIPPSHTTTATGLPTMTGDGEGRG